MKLWLQVRQIQMVGMALLVALLGLAAIGNTSVPLPNLSGGVLLRFPSAIFLPLIIAIAMARSLSYSNLPIEQVATRPVVLLDKGFVLIIGGLYAGCSAILWVLGFPSTLLIGGRNALGYLGLTLLGRRLIGSHGGAVLPAAFAILASLLGSGVDRIPDWWAWPIAAASSWWAWAWALGLLAASIAWELFVHDHA